MLELTDVMNHMLMIRVYVN